MCLCPVEGNLVTATLWKGFLMAVILLVYSGLVMASFFSHTYVTPGFKVCVGLRRRQSSGGNSQGLHDPCSIQTYTHKDSSCHRYGGNSGAAGRGRSSFLIGYPPLPGGQHVVERVPADACSVKGGQEGTDCWSTVSNMTHCPNYSAVCRRDLWTWRTRYVFITCQKIHQDAVLKRRKKPHNTQSICDGFSIEENFVSVLTWP